MHIDITVSWWAELRAVKLECNSLLETTLHCCVH